MTRSALLRPYYFVLLAGALLRAGTSTARRRALDESAARRRRDRASTPTTPSTRGCRPKCYVATGAMDAPSRSSCDALEISRAPGRPLARAARRARLRALPRRARPPAPRPATSSPPSAWFTEGRETMDYLYAEGLLKTLEA